MNNQEIQLFAVARFLQGASDHDKLDAFQLIAECDCWHCVKMTALPLPMAIYLHSLFVILYPPPICKVVAYENIFLINEQSHPSNN